MTSVSAEALPLTQRSNMRVRCGRLDCGSTKIWRPLGVLSKIMAKAFIKNRASAYFINKLSKKQYLSNVV
jgi:hypothetical protein